jgi:thiol-disulfide isomerase/thioredoxin
MVKLFSSALVTLALVSTASAMEVMADKMMPEMNLGMGARGDKVVMLQDMLISKGFLVLPAGSKKGTFGPSTKRAVMKYQTSLGVSATGYYGMKTREKMKMMMGEGMKDTMMDKKDAMMEKKDMMKDDMKKDVMMMKGSYEGYTADKLAAYAKTGPVVIFFHAAWCPLCRATEADIVANMSKIPEGLHILKADYDTETALKAKYGVTVQTTFVVVGGDMMKKKMWTGQSTLAEIVNMAK